jgi:hypothetical protein
MTVNDSDLFQCPIPELVWKYCRKPQKILIISVGVSTEIRIGHLAKKFGSVTAFVNILCHSVHITYKNV